MRVRHVVLLLLPLLLVPTAGGQECGAIVQTGATIASGTAPTRGEVLVDPCGGEGTLPEIVLWCSPDPIGTLTGTLPFVEPGTGGADQHFTSSETLPGASYHFSSYTVDQGVTVTYTGPVRITTTGDVDIRGTVTTNADGASIVIQCGGAFHIQGEDIHYATVETEGPASQVSIMVEENLTGGFPSAISAQEGDVVLGARGSTSSDGRIELDGTNVRARNGAVTMVCRNRLLIRSGSSGADGGAFSLTSLEGSVALEGPMIDGGNDLPGGIDVDAATQIDVTGNVDLHCGAGSIAMTAYSGSINIDGAYSISTNTGDQVYNAAGSVRIQNGASLHCSSGETRISGRQQLGFIPGVTIDSAYVGAGSGDIRVGAEGDVILSGAAQVHSDSGRVDVCGWSAVLRGTARIGRGVFYYGPIHVRAAEITAEGGEAHIHGSTVRLDAGTGGLSLDLDHVRAETGDLTIRSDGDATIRGRAEAHGNLTIEASHLLVDLAGATVVTDDRTGEPSGWILIENWVGALSTIDLTDATVTSGQSDTQSGDVTVRIRTRSSLPHGGGGYVLPKRAVVKLDARDPSRSRLILAGFCDLGTGDADLTEELTVEVGRLDMPGKGPKLLAVEVPGMDANRKGTKFRYKADGTKFLVKPSKRGSSLAKFKLVLKADLGEDLDPEEALSVRLDGTHVYGEGTVRLTKGKYALRKVRGTLVEPNLYLAKAKARILGEGRDKLALQLGLATEGATPAEAPALSLGFGESLAVEIPSESFVAKGDRFEFRGDADGITSVVLDYRREILVIKGKGLDLGSFEEGANAVDVSVGLGDDERAVRVRMARKGSSLRY